MWGRTRLWNHDAHHDGLRAAAWVSTTLSVLPVAQGSGLVAPKQQQQDGDGGGRWEWRGADEAFFPSSGWGCVWWDCPISGMVPMVGAGCSEVFAVPAQGMLPGVSLQVFPVPSLWPKAIGSVPWPWQRLCWRSSLPAGPDLSTHQPKLGAKTQALLASGMGSGGMLHLPDQICWSIKKHFQLLPHWWTSTHRCCCRTWGQTGGHGCVTCSLPSSDGM